MGKIKKEKSKLKKQIKNTFNDIKQINKHHKLDEIKFKYDEIHDTFILDYLNIFERGLLNLSNI